MGVDILNVVHTDARHAISEIRFSANYAEFRVHNHTRNLQRYEKQNKIKKPSGKKPRVFSGFEIIKYFGQQKATSIRSEFSEIFYHYFFSLPVSSKG